VIYGLFNKGRGVCVWGCVCVCVCIQLFFIRSDRFLFDQSEIWRLTFLGFVQILNILSAAVNKMNREAFVSSAWENVTAVTSGSLSGGIHSK